MEQDFNEKLLDTTIDLPKIPTDKLPDSAGKFNNLIWFD